MAKKKEPLIDGVPMRVHEEMERICKMRKHLRFPLLKSFLDHSIRHFAGMSCNEYMEKSSYADDSVMQVTLLLRRTFGERIDA